MFNGGSSSGSAPTDPFLSVRNLSVAFRNPAGAWNDVVHDVSFDINPGETLAIVGESGSGKSVTSLSIARLLSRSVSRHQGQIWMNGRDLLTCSEEEMRHIRGGQIGMIFQEPMTSLNPVMTVASQLCEPLIRHRGLTRRAALAEAKHLLERVRIPNAERRLQDYPHNLSGGMRQRVMIAMALAGNPRLLIADEPTTALDVTVQSEILNLIKILQDEDKTSILFITHDMGVVAEMADRTLVMYQGRDVEAGPTAEIFSVPQHDYTKLLLSAVPQFRAVANPAPARPKPTPAVAKPILEVEDLTMRFRIRGSMFAPERTIHAVEKVSLSLRAGETLALVGESGSGKSTMGRSIMRLSEPTSGKVLLDGQDILSITQRQFTTVRPSIQMIFQDPYASLDPRMRVGATIAEAMLVHGLVNSAQVQNAVAVLMKRVGLEPEMAARYPHQFSGGQRQRICIARALALNPRIIVADECVSALDASIKAQIIDLMMDLQQTQQMSYLFISHDMAVVEKISHRVAVMYRGEIVEIGPSAAIFGDARHPYTRKLLETVPSGDPTNRNRRRAASTEELTGVVRERNYQPVRRVMECVGPDHLVQVTPV